MRDAANVHDAHLARRGVARAEEGWTAHGKLTGDRDCCRCLSRRRMQRTQRISTQVLSCGREPPRRRILRNPSRICGNVLQHFSEMFSTRIRTPNGQRALEREDMALASRYPVSRSTMYGGWHASTSLQHRLPPAARLWGARTHTRDARAWSGRSRAVPRRVSGRPLSALAVETCVLHAWPLSLPSPLKPETLTSRGPKSNPSGCTRLAQTSVATPEGGRHLPPACIPCCG